MRNLWVEILCMIVCWQKGTTPIAQILHFTLEWISALDPSNNGTFPPCTLSQKAKYLTNWATRALSLYKDSLSRYRDFHHKDKAVRRPSYLYNGKGFIGKMASLYWDGPLAFDKNRSPNNTAAFQKKDFNCMGHFSVKEWCIMQINWWVSSRRHNSSVLAMELRFSSINLSKCSCIFKSVCQFN